MNAVRRRYWELGNIGMVNWYLFTAQDIALRGRIALTGPNGSGKSSILDAIQTVLTSAHHRHLQLNSLVQADKSAGRRTVRDYVLGTLDDVDEGPAVIRDQALSYLLLGFRRLGEKGGKPREVTVGICIEAREDSPDEEVKGRFIVEGRMLRAEPLPGQEDSDVARVGEDDDGKWAEAISWAEVQSRLRRTQGLTLHTFNGPEAFVKAICRIVGPDLGMVDHQKFLRNLKNAAAFKPVGNTTDFVRNFILDAQPLNLKVLRESIARFKAIQAKIADLKKRIAEVEDLSGRVARVHTRHRTLLNHKLSVAQGRIVLAAQALQQAKRDAETTAAGLAAVANEIPALEEAERQAEARYRSAIEVAASNAVAASADRAASQAKLHVAEAAAARAELGPAVRLAGEIAIHAPLLAPFQPATAKAMEAFGKKPGEAAAKAADLPGSVISEGLISAAAKLERDIGSAEAALGRSEALVAELQENLRRVREGKRVLGRSTQNLARLMEEGGIKATPLCDLVEAVDPDWRKVTEAILGPAREALIVDPRRYEAALRLYRSSDVRGAMLVNTTKTKGTRPAKDGTLATIVEASDPHARAFLDYRLGGVLMVSTEAELKREETAATSDMMYASGRTHRRLDAPQYLVLGAAGDATLAEQLEGDLELETSTLKTQRRRIEQLRSAHRSVSRLAEDIAQMDATALGIALERAVGAEKKAEECAAEAERLRAEGGGALREAVAEAERLLQEGREATERKKNERARLDERMRAQQEKNSSLEAEEATTREHARTLLAESGGVMTPDEEEQALWWIHAPMPDFPDLSHSMADPEADDAGGRPTADTLESKLYYIEYNLVRYHERRLGNDRGNLVMQAGRYMNTHSMEIPDFIRSDEMDPSQKFKQTAAWIEGERENLENMVLKDYEREAGEAHADAVRHFKGDFVGKMRGAFEEITGRLKELNRQLAKRDFHGLTYRFDRKSSLSHRDMIALVEASDSPDFELALESGGAVSGDSVARAIRRLEQIALDPEADLGDLEDPRRYWEFDISMDKDGIPRTTMSKRLGTGSGGQVQVPYYVAICAALAATYYPDRTGLDGGMALSIFDEAFNRMDTAVIGEVIGFMGDVGLQPFIAAPDKERATFMQFVDTLIGLSRTGTAVTLDVQYVKPLAHQTFREQNPHLYGFDRFQAEQEAKVAAE